MKHQIHIPLLGILWVLASCQHPLQFAKKNADLSTSNDGVATSSTSPQGRTLYHTPYGDDQYASYLKKRFAPHLTKLPIPEGQLNRSLVESIPPDLQPEVKQWIRYFQTKAKRTFSEWMTRGDAIRTTIMPILEERGLPSDLFYVAMIESGFNNRACSPRQAGGPWQFIGATARLQGLEMTHWVDERLDPVKSTMAAVVYWKKLYQTFGDWNLAIAAYNSGPRIIQDMLRKTTREKFWAYSKGRLNQETRNFTPKALAAILVGQNPEAYGIIYSHNPEMMFPLHYAYVATPTSLHQISEAYNIPYKKLVYWNPELIHGKTPPQPPFLLPGYPVRLPEALGHQVRSAPPTPSQTPTAHSQEAPKNENVKKARKASKKKPMPARSKA